MARLNKDKIKQKKAAAKKPPARNMPLPVPKTVDDSEQTDYGGMPNRDLKKNLGCG